MKKKIENVCQNYKKILITGASGRIGQKLLLWLEKNTKYELILTSRRKPKYNENRSIWIKADLNKTEDLEKLFNKCPDLIIHLAATVGYKDSPSIMEHKEVELNPSLNLIDYLIKLNRKIKFIFASSGGTVYKNSNLPHDENEVLQCSSIYSCNKIYIEQILWLYKELLNPVILRISNPYGMCINPNVKQGIIDIALDCAKNNKIFTIWDSPNNVRDFIYIDDVCEAFYKSILYNQNKYAIFNIGSGCGLSVIDIMNLIKLKFIKFNYTIINLKKSNISCNLLNISKARKDLNWNPRTSVAKYIQGF